MEYTFDAVLHEIPENVGAYVIFEIDDGNSMGTEQFDELLPANEKCRN